MLFVFQTLFRRRYSSFIFISQPSAFIQSQSSPTFSFLATDIYDKLQHKIKQRSLGKTEVQLYQEHISKTIYGGLFRYISGTI